MLGKRQMFQGKLCGQMVGTSMMEGDRGVHVIEYSEDMPSSRSVDSSTVTEITMGLDKRNTNGEKPQESPCHHPVTSIQVGSPNGHISLNICYKS